jgi:hypothetical protein
MAKQHSFGTETKKSSSAKYWHATKSLQSSTPLEIHVREPIMDNFVVTLVYRMERRFGMVCLYGKGLKSLVE